MALTNISIDGLEAGSTLQIDADPIINVVGTSHTLQLQQGTYALTVVQPIYGTTNTTLNVPEAIADIVATEVTTQTQAFIDSYVSPEGYFNLIERNLDTGVYSIDTVTLNPDMVQYRTTMTSGTVNPAVNITSGDSITLTGTTYKTIEALNANGDVIDAMDLEFIVTVASTPVTLPAVVAGQIFRIPEGAVIGTVVGNIQYTGDTPSTFLLSTPSDANFSVNSAGVVTLDVVADTSINTISVRPMHPDGTPPYENITVEVIPYVESVSFARFRDDNDGTGFVTLKGLRDTETYTLYSSTTETTIGNILSNAGGNMENLSPINGELAVNLIGIPAFIHVLPYPENTIGSAIITLQQPL